MMTKFLLFFAFTVVLVSLCIASPSINVIANIRGKKYDISAETVAEFSEQVESLSGLSSNEQSVLFKGKILSSHDKLSDLGVGNGDVLNVLKGKRRKNKLPESLKKGFSPESVENELMDDFQSSNLDSDDALKNIDPDQVKRAMKAMDNLLDSNFVEEYFSDDEKLENARIQMLENLDQYEQMMPGFKDQAKEIASDPEKWKQAMMNAKEQIVKLKKQRDSMRGQSADLNDIR